jgi:hypothetical protein
MLVFTSPRSLRRLAAILLTAGAVAFASQGTPAQAQTGCEPSAYVPQYNSYTHWAEAYGYVRCSGYYEIRLKTTSGATLAQQSGNYVSALTLYTNWVTCPSGTTVYTYLYEKATVQGNSYTYTAISPYFTCP